MNMRRAREITFEKLGSNFSQMQTSQLYLRSVSAILGHHLLCSTLGILGEDMSRCRQAKRHHIFSTLGYFHLALRVSHHLHVGRMIHFGMVHGLGMNARSEG